MLLVIIGVGILFGSIGFLITQNNARQWLAGYNTMKPEEQAKFPLTLYIRRFRRFHLFLGATVILGGLISYYFFSKDWTMMFLSLYPIACYSYFALSNRSRIEPSKRKTSTFAITILLICLVGLSMLFWVSRREDPIELNSEELSIGGIYGIKIAYADVDSVFILPQAPTIKSKLHGFAMSEIKKGTFRLEDGSEARLILNTMDSDVLLIRLVDDTRVYYSGVGYDEFDLALELRSRLN